jgi:hypothetical protein
MKLSTTTTCDTASCQTPAQTQASTAVIVASMIPPELRSREKENCKSITLVSSRHAEDLNSTGTTLLLTIRKLVGTMYSTALSTLHTCFVIFCLATRFCCPRNAVNWLVNWLLLLVRTPKRRSRSPRCNFLKLTASGVL